VATWQDWWKFSMDAYIKTLKNGGRDIMNTSLYGDDIFSHIVSGITLLHGLPL